MNSQQQIIEELNRKITLLDEYASTLERENLAKNNETATLYCQLDEVRIQNDILRSHLSRINQENIERMRKQQSERQIQQINTSVNSSVEMHFNSENREIRNETQTICVSCQTQFNEPAIDLNTIHLSCTQEIQKLLSTISQKDTKIQQINKQSQQMYDTIVHLEEENQSLKRQIHETQTKFKTQAKQLKSYQLQIDELRAVLNQEREIIENQRRQIQEQLNSSTIAEHQVDRLIRQNNRLIEKIRMLEKQKNTFYAQLRGKNVSPLKTSQISSRQVNLPSQKKSFIGNAYLSEQKSQPQRFSSQFGIGKQKEKLKADRWKKIQEKINRVKQENQQLRANLTIY